VSICERGCWLCRVCSGYLQQLHAFRAACMPYGSQGQVCMRLNCALLCSLIAQAVLSMVSQVFSIP
jgi:hypothetical protein